MLLEFNVLSKQTQNKQNITKQTHTSTKTTTVDYIYSFFLFFCSSPPPPLKKKQQTNTQIAAQQRSQPPHSPIKFVSDPRCNIIEKWIDPAGTEWEKLSGWLGGGFKYFLFSPLFGEDSHFG